MNEKQIEATTVVGGEIQDPKGQAEVLAKLVMAMMKKQGITEMNIAERNFTDCDGWMFKLEQRIKHGQSVLTIVMERTPDRKQTGN